MFLTFKEGIIIYLWLIYDEPVADAYVELLTNFAALIAVLKQLLVEEGL